MDMRCFAILSLVLGVCSGVLEKDEIVCTGTIHGVSRQYGDEDVHYENLKSRYTNCTYVEGNLEISWLLNPSYDLDFLSTIREVTGYVLILLVFVEEIPLTSLRVVRGEYLYSDSYAVYSVINQPDDGGSQVIGLQRLLMPSLKEIVNGSVYFEDNTRLKYLPTIQWDDIQNPASFQGNVFIEYGGPCDSSCESGICWGPKPEQCKSWEGCDPSCESRSCWGPGPENCQILTKKICSSSCDYRCRGVLPADCCHKSCAAGCINSSNTGCLACLNFTNGNECMAHCSPRFIYDPITYGSIPNPAFKLAHGFRCVNGCPDNMLENGDNCVEHCPAGMMEEDRKCKTCEGACPRSCLRLDRDDILYAEHFDNGALANCTIIDGNIIISRSTFYGDIFGGYTPVTAEMLQQFKTVKEITGYLVITGDHAYILMPFFENLEKIHGRSLYGERFAALAIVRTALNKTNLENLKEIKNGNVYIADNPDLCYVTAEVFQRLLPSDSNADVENNRNIESCAELGRVCHPNCEPIGCWGPDPDQCAQCRNAQIDRLCVPSCRLRVHGLRLYEKVSGTSSEPAVCDYCNGECISSCVGPDPDQCLPLNDPDACRNVQDGPFCRSECPQSKYPDASGVCQFCDENCVDDAFSKVFEVLRSAISVLFG